MKNEHLPTIFPFIYFAMTFLAFYPSRYYLPLFSSIGILFWGVAFFVLIKNKFKPSKLLILFTCYQFWFLISTFINKEFDVSLILSAFRLILYFYSLEVICKINYKKAINIIFVCSFFFVFLDIISIYLYPEGMHNNISSVGTNVYIEEQKSWILGIKNNRIYWYLLVLLSMYLKFINGHGFYKRIIIIFTIISLFTFYRINADTSLVVMFIASLSVWLNFAKKNFSIHNVKLYFYLIILISAILITGGLAFILSDIGYLFGKDATLSGRTNIWAMVISDVLSSPIIGKGIIQMQEAIELMGNYAFVNAHNQWLQTFWQGGIILVIIFILFFRQVINSISNCYDSKLKTTLFFFMVTIFIEMSMEVIFSNYSCWTIIFLIYCTIKYYQETLVYTKNKRTS